MTDKQIQAITQALQPSFDQDTIQETLCALVQYPPTLTHAKLTTYAFTVAKRIVWRQRYVRQRDRQRQSRDPVLRPVLLALDAVEETQCVPEQEEIAMVKEALGALTPEQAKRIAHHC